MRALDLERQATVKPPAPSRAAPAVVRPGERRALLRLQRAAGNRVVQRALAAVPASGGALPGDLERGIDAARGSGRPLNRDIREAMESTLGADLGAVRVHDDPRSHDLNRELSSRAFATGVDVFFGSGQYVPHLHAGRQLIAHELTHVVQQAGGIRVQLAVGPVDDEYEREAEAVARSYVDPGSGPAGAQREDGEELE